jgi:hypothetical protein
MTGSRRRRKSDLPILLFFATDFRSARSDPFTDSYCPFVFFQA